MAKIYRITDKISYKIGDIEIKVSPLSVENKLAITEFMFQGQKGDLKSMMTGSVYSLRCSIKEITGLTDANDEPYVLEFENGMLTESCAQDLLNIEQSNSLIGLCSSFVGGIPNKLPDGVVLNIPKKKTMSK
jgi:hypothetical protein